MIEQKDLAFEQAILIGIINQNQSEERIHEYLDELAFLTHTAGGTVAKRFTQRMETPHPKTFIGSGKMEEVLAYVKTHDISTVVFDDELTPCQQSNIEQLLKCKILDRTGLILIFLHSAPKQACPYTSGVGAVQISLTKTQRVMDSPRTSTRRNWMRGPGETEIETDRRIVRDKISL